MRNLYFILIACLGVFQATAQVDEKLAATLKYNSELQSGALHEMNKETDSMSSLQKQIAIKQLFIVEVKQKIEKNYEKVSGRMEEGKTVMYITHLTSSIVGLQNEIINIVVDDPKLIILAADVQEKTIWKLAGLSTQIFNFILVGGKDRMISTKERVELLNDIQKELKELRGVLLSTRNKLWYAKRYGFLATWNPRLNRQLNTLKHRRKLQDLFNQKGYGGGLNFY